MVTKLTLKALPAVFAPPKDDEASLYNLPEMAPLIEMGYQEGKAR